VVGKLLDGRSEKVSEKMTKETNAQCIDQLPLVGTAMKKKKKRMQLLIAQVMMLGSIRRCLTQDSLMLFPQAKVL